MASLQAPRSPRRAGRGAALVAALALACGSQPEPPLAPLAGFDVVLINVDTLRADHTELHGYARPTTPFLRTLADESVVFENALTNSSFTRESVASLFTGQLPSHSGATGWNAAPPSRGPHLAQQFRDAGYRTGFLSNTVMLRAPGFTRGFDVAQHLPKRWDLSGEGPRLTQRALAFLEAADLRPTLLYLHYLDPHAPYQPGAATRARFGPEPTQSPLGLYTDVEPQLPALRASGFGPGDPRYDDLIARYDAEIAETDAALASLFAGIERIGRPTLAIVTADHGEEFLEHGYVEHGWSLHEESVHVPLLFWAPGALAPARVAARVSQVDVLPTLEALVGLAPGGAPLDGEPLFDASARPAPSDRPRIAELLLPRRNVLRAIWSGDWKYVAAYRFVPPEARGRAGDGTSPTSIDLGGAPVREWLFDRAADPDEARNRIADSPDRAHALRTALTGQAAAATLEEGAAPAVSPEEAERLRALGYH